MFSCTQKLIHILLALIILLTPMQFVFAQDMDTASTLSSLADETSMHHQQMKHSMTNSMDIACDDDVTCTDCAYCSPALALSSLIILGKLPSAPQLLAVVSRTSIDLAVESRPPKQL